MRPPTTGPTIAPKGTTSRVPSTACASPSETSSPASRRRGAPVRGATIVHLAAQSALPHGHHAPEATAARGDQRRTPSPSVILGRPAVGEELAAVRRALAQLSRPLVCGCGAVEGEGPRVGCTITLRRGVAVLSVACPACAVTPVRSLDAPRYAPTVRAVARGNTGGAGGLRALTSSVHPPREG